jgi:hypothetical protein
MRAEELLGIAGVLRAAAGLVVLLVLLVLGAAGLIFGDKTAWSKQRTMTYVVDLNPPKKLTRTTLSCIQAAENVIREGRQDSKLLLWSDVENENRRTVSAKIDETKGYVQLTTQANWARGQRDDRFKILHTFKNVILATQQPDGIPTLAVLVIDKAASRLMLMDGGVQYLSDELTSSTTVYDCGTAQ